ncbi:hypothetical protein AN161_14190 [Lysinibacillus sp. FJAT-14222]|nr:hypothetical protein AN161_14190 [Lysinibacillus sp. FJAT-14222]
MNVYNIDFGKVNGSSAKRGIDFRFGCALSLGGGATNVFCAKTSANLAAAAGCFLREWTPLHLASGSHILNATANFHHLVDGARHTKKSCLSARDNSLKLLSFVLIL